MNEMNDQKRLQLAYNRILKLEERIKGQKNQDEKSVNFNPSPVAVVGAACRYPGAVNSVESLWKSFETGTNVIREIPESRWDLKDIYSENKNEPNKTYCRYGAFFEAIDEFDPLFFNISNKEAERMDPQQRLFLQGCWEAFEDAGYNDTRLNGVKCGVYAGSLNCDYTNVLNATPHNADLFELMGTQTSILSARISYLLNLKGPSITIDTACSSSLVAIDLAVKAIQRGDIDLALAGGVHLYITPNLYIMMSKAQMLSIDGQSRAFDNRANGFAPGEGMAVIALKALDKALADGDQIYGVILGGASNQDGKTNGITAPSSLAQTELELEAYQKLNINPETIGYIEAHGTGTKLGDPIEFEALSKSFGSYTQKQNFCAIGSSKTNFGHTLSAAGVTGVLKALLAMRNRKIPANLNFTKANEHLEYEQSPFYINNTLIDWKNQPFPRRSAVSSFGFSGTNVHLLLEEAPQVSSIREVTPPPALLLLFSAKTQAALQQKITDFKTWLSAPENMQTPLEDVAITLMRGRCHFKYRTGFVVSSKADLLQQLESWAMPQSTGSYGSSEEINALIAHLKLPENFSNNLFSDSLVTLLKHYINGGSGDWWDLMENTGARTVSLPTYPFELEKFWIVPQTESTQESDNSNSFSLVDSNESTLESQCYQKTFTGNEFYLKDHVVNLRKMLPGVAYLEMARSSGNLCNKPHRVTRIQNVTWQNPIVVDGGPQTVKISLHPDTEGVAFQVFSTNSDDSKGTVHAFGNLIYDNQRSQDEYIAVEELRTELTEFLSQKQCYDTFKEKGLEYGSTFKRILNLSYQGDRALATLEGLTSDTSGDALHPGIMDAALQAVLVLVSQVVEKSSQHYLPYTIEQLEIRHPLTTRCHSFVTRRQKASNDPAEYFDVKLADESGKVLLCVSGLKLVPVQQSSATLTATAEQLYFSHQLQQTDIEQLTPETVQQQVRGNHQAAGQATIILIGNQADETPLLDYAQLNEYLPTIKVNQANKFSNDANGTFHLDLSQPDHAELLLESLAASQITPEFVVWSLPPAASLSVEEKIKQFQFLCRLAKHFIQYKTTRMLRLITLEQSSQGALDNDSAYSGFYKTLAQENPNYIGKHLVFDHHQEPKTITQAAVNELFNKDFNPYPVLYTGGKRYKKRLQILDLAPTADDKSSPLFKDGGVYLITGGLRGVGLTLAEEIAKLADATLILVGRSSPTAEAQNTIAHIREKQPGASISVIEADITNSDTCTKLIERILHAHGKLNGILHCAGIKRDSFILKKTDADIRDVLLPKTAGTVCLDEATRHINLDFFALFSSIAAVFGNPGQSDYAFANGFMDDFAAYRNACVQQGTRKGRTVSINWPLWQTGGMQLDDASFASMNELFGMQSIDGRLGIKVLQNCLRHSSDSVMFMYGDQARTEKSLRKGLAGGSKEQQTDIKHLNTAQRDNVLIETERFIKLLISDEMKIPYEKLDSDAPFENFGMDSVVYMSLNQKLEELFGKISKTLFYEYQNIGALADYFVENYLTQVLDLTETQVRSSDKAIEVPTVPTGNTEITSDTPLPRFKNTTMAIAPVKSLDVAIIGIAGRYPQANTLQEFWENLLQGKDCVEEIPSDRWDHNLYFDETRGTPGKTYSKWGGFISDHDRFDARFFNISPKEAALIDPQERVFLETSWQALADAGYSNKDLPKDRVGVYAGVMWSQYQLLGVDPQYTLEGSVPESLISSVANRVSYFFDFHGPSIGLDTMCSSSLTALHMACEAMRSGEIDYALAGGVNLIVHPNKYLRLAQGNFAATDGRCRSFGAGGDGYVPGEGVGVALLKPLDKALADHDHIYGVIKSTHINHGGKTNGYTVPNPIQQGELIRHTLDKANINPESISYVEAHGTGTALGDPIEITGLTQAYQSKTDKTGFCALGSVKANIGHLESAAGISALSKVLLQLKHDTLVPTLHCQQENPNIDLEATPFVLQKNIQPWSQVLKSSPEIIREKRRAAISSFGAGGANAHMIIEEAPRLVSAPQPENHEYIFILSAKDGTRLENYAKVFSMFLEKSAQTPASLQDIAFTLMVGRDAEPARLAVVARSYDELLKGINDFVAKAPASSIPYYSAVLGNNPEQSALLPSGESGKAYLKSLLDHHEFAKLAALWTQGAVIDWQTLFANHKPHRISLPIAPLQRERYWIERNESAGSNSVGKSQALHELLDCNISTLDRQAYTKQFTGSEAVIRDHRINDNPILPAAAYIEMVNTAMHLATAQTAQKIQHLHWHAPVLVKQEPVETQLELQVQHNTIGFTISAKTTDGGETLCCSGEILEAQSSTENNGQQFDIGAHLPNHIDHNDFYNTLADKGFTYCGPYRSVAHITFDNDRAIAFLSDKTLQSTEGYLRNSTLLDAAFQAVVPLLPAASQELYVPAALRSICFHEALDHANAVVVTRTDDLQAKQMSYDIAITDSAGRSLVSLEAFTVAPFTIAAPRSKQPEANTGPHIFTTKWTPITLPPEIPGSDLAANTILLDLKKIGLELKGISLQAGQEFSSNANSRYTLDLNKAEHWKMLFEEFSSPSQDVLNLVLVEPQNNNEIGYLENQLSLFQALTKALNGRKLRLLVLQQCACQYGGALSGFVKSLALEYPNISASSLLVSETAPAIDINRAITLELERDACKALASEAFFDGKDILVKSIDDKPNSNSDALPLVNHGVYLVTGGAGGIGKLVCQYLATEYRANIILTGRTEMTPQIQSFIDELRNSGSEALYLQADVSNQSSMANVVEKTLARFGKLQGLIHSAGLTRDALLVNKTSESFSQVLSPKIRGVEILDSVTAKLNLDFFVVFSSLSAVLGNPGQIDYACANAYLDYFTQQRQARVNEGERHGKSISINWPYWQAGGMQLSDKVISQIEASTGLQPLSTQDGLKALEQALVANNPQALVCFGDKLKILASLNGSNSKAAPITPTAPSPSVSESTARTNLSKRLRKLLADETRWDFEKITESDSFGTFGVDSVMTLNLTRKLSEDFGELPKTLFFEYNTIAQLSDYFITHHFDAVAALTEVPKPSSTVIAAEQYTTKLISQEPALARRDYLRGKSAQDSKYVNNEAIAIIGIAGRYPGAESLQAFYHNLCNGVDAISEIPTERWDGGHYFDGNRQQLQKGKTYSRWGGFIDEVDQFDPLFFNISPADAITMDPQERLFLESSWHAFEDAGYTPENLSGSKTGVFTGVMWSHYQLFGVDTVPEQSAKMPESSYSSIANRVSYFFELQGPSLAVDTMCSSSLTAIYLACEALRRNDCHMALAGGVNLSLHPYKYQQLGGSQFLSSDGRCRSFGEGGDGYVPGEGVGAILLKPVSKAQADGDKIYGVIKGGALNHGGNSNGYNVPNPRAQGDLIQSAIQSSGVAAKNISYIEAHGTGTPLGDPIELQGLKRAFADTAKPANCAIGSVKSNIGHLEAASGIAALTKVLLQMQSRSLFPSLHANTLNQNLDFSDSPFQVQTKLTQWQSNDAPRTAGISSFGAGGSNAFIVLEEVQTTSSRDSGAYDDIVFPFSAHTLRSLQAVVRQYQQLLQQISTQQLPQHNAYTFESLAYSLQNKRSAHSYRLAVVSKSLEDLGKQLAAVNVDEQKYPTFCYFGNSDESQTTARPEITAANPEQLAQQWVSGGDVNFHAVYPALNNTALWLPPYPFSKKKYWYEGRRSYDTALTIKHSPDFTSGALDCVLDFNSSMQSGLQYKTKIRKQHVLAKDHTFNGQPLLPGAAFISLIARTMAKGVDNKHLQLRKLAWQKPLFVQQDTPLFATYVSRANSQYSCSLWTGSEAHREEHLSTLIDTVTTVPLPNATILTGIDSAQSKTIDKTHFYALFEPYQISYRGVFRCVESARFNEHLAESVYHIAPSDPHTQLTLLIDATLQSFVLLQRSENPQIKLPFSVESIIINNSLFETALEPELAGRIRIQSTGENSGDAEVLGNDGTQLVSLRGIQFRNIAQQTPITHQITTEIEPLLTDHVLQVFRKHMNLERGEITPKTSFDRLGLESVVAVNIVTELRVLSQDIPTGYLLEHKSVAGLVAALLNDFGKDVQSYFDTIINISVSDSPPLNTGAPNEQINAARNSNEPFTEEQLLQVQLPLLQKVFSDALAMSPQELGFKVNFDKYGLESVKATEITRKLSEHYGELPSTLLFEYQTLTSLSKFLVSERTESCRKIATKSQNTRSSSATTISVKQSRNETPLSESDLKERVNQLTDSEVDSLLNNLLGSLTDVNMEQNSYES